MKQSREVVSSVPSRKAKGLVEGMVNVIASLAELVGAPVSPGDASAEARRVGL